MKKWRELIISIKRLTIWDNFLLYLVCWIRGQVSVHICVLYKISIGESFFLKEKMWCSRQYLPSCHWGLCDFVWHMGHLAAVVTPRCSTLLCNIVLCYRVAPGAPFYDVSFCLSNNLLHVYYNVKQRRGWSTKVTFRYLFSLYTSL